MTNLVRKYRRIASIVIGRKGKGGVKGMGNKLAKKSKKIKKIAVVVNWVNKKKLWLY